MCRNWHCHSYNQIKVVYCSSKFITQHNWIGYSFAIRSKQIMMTTLLRISIGQLNTACSSTFEQREQKHGRKRPRRTPQDVAANRTTSLRRHPTKPRMTVWERGIYRVRVSVSEWVNDSYLDKEQMQTNGSSPWIVSPPWAGWIQFPSSGHHIISNSTRKKNQKQKSIFNIPICSWRR